MAQNKPRVFTLEDGLQWHGERFEAGEQLLPFAMVVSMLMLQGKSKAEANRIAEGLPTSLDEEESKEAESKEESQGDESEDKLPEKFPYAGYFHRAGITSIEEVNALDDMTTVDGISENRKADVEEYLQTLSDSEG